MNSIIAQGAPNSLIRKFQDNPQLGIDCLVMFKAIVAVAEHGLLNAEAINEAKLLIERIEK